MQAGRPDDGAAGSAPPRLSDPLPRGCPVSVGGIGAKVMDRTGQGQASGGRLPHLNNCPQTIQHQRPLLRKRGLMMRSPQRVVVGTGKVPGAGEA